MATTFNCGFARDAANKCLSDGTFQALSAKARYAKYLEYFGESYKSFFHLEAKAFRVNCKKLREIIGNWRGVEKVNYFSNFSRSRWNELREIEKQNHTVRNCQACKTNHSAFQLTFPTAKTRTREALKKSITPIQPLPKQPLCNITNTTGSVRSTSSKSTSTAYQLFQAAGDVFHKETGQDFRKTLFSVKELKLQEKRSSKEKYQEKENIQRDSVRNIENSWATKDTQAFYTGRMSLS